MADTDLKYEVENEIGILTFQRGEAHHAISPNTVKELERSLDHLERKANIKALFITASGEKSFVAGGDLKYFNEILNDRTAGLRFHRHMRKVLRRVANLPFPVICAANGDMYGGGCEIALAADMLVIASHASIHFRQAAVGLSTGWGGGPRLVRRVGYHRACKLLLTGAVVPAEEALKIGLVDDVVNCDFPKWIQELGAKIAVYPPDVIYNILGMLRAAGSKWWDVALQTEVHHFESLWNGPAFKRAVKKFMGEDSDYTG